jgi:hypothetical protein
MYAFETLENAKDALSKAEKEYPNLRWAIRQNGSSWGVFGEEATND